jgi:hypothetical protein
MAAGQPDFATMANSIVQYSGDWLQISLGSPTHRLLTTVPSFCSSTTWSVTLHDRNILVDKSDPPSAAASRHIAVNVAFGPNLR